MESASVVGREFLASYQQYRDFVSSTLWYDLQSEIKSWIDDLHACLEDEDDNTEFHRFQGRIQACRELLNLPDRILSAMEVAQEVVDNPEEVLVLDLDSASSTSDEFYQEQLQKWSGEDLENA